MKGLLVRILFLLFLLMWWGSAVDDITLVPLPSHDLSDNCEIEHPLLKPDPWRTWDNITKTIKRLFNGKTVTNSTRDFYDDFRKTHDFCDFLTSYEPLRENWHYVPATCVAARDCVHPEPFKITWWGSKACRTLAKDINLKYGDEHLSKKDMKTYTCCPVNGTRLWNKYFTKKNNPNLKQDRRLLEFTEIPPTFQLINASLSFASVSGRNYEVLYPEDQKALKKFFKKKNDKIFHVKEARVCGFVREPESFYHKEGRDLHKWYPYLCVKPNECDKARLKGQTVPPANPLWHQLCSDKFTPESNPRRDFSEEPKYIFKETNQDTVCCHINDVGEKYLNASTGGYVATPQIPTFFRITPGLRSLYKCEEYAKRVCDKAPDGKNLCVEGFNNPPEPGENPHMASLGVIVRKMMIFHCGGALVSLRYIISAASCKHWFGYEVNVVMLGEHETATYEYGKERFYLITEITQAFGYPPAFRPKPWQDPSVRPKSEEIDLALYKTEVEVEFTRYIRPACLWHGHRSWPHYPQFLGWGSYDAYRSEYLKTLTGLQETKLCTSDKFLGDTVENPFYARYGAINDWMVCLKDHPHEYERHDKGRNPCSSDLGGPLQEKLIQPYCSALVLGVLSSRSFCEQKIPSVFINISQFIGAIEDEVWGSYLFLDLEAKRFEKPSCGESDGFYFFNKCINGNECQK